MPNCSAHNLYYLYTEGCSSCLDASAYTWALVRMPGETNRQLSERLSHFLTLRIGSRQTPETVMLESIIRNQNFPVVPWNAFDDYPLPGISFRIDGFICIH